MLTLYLRGRIAAQFAYDLLAPTTPGQAVHLLATIARAGGAWEIDWAAVPDRALHGWVRADMAGRVLRALLEGREIHYGDRVWRGSGERSLVELATEIEATIVADDLLVRVTDDAPPGGQGPLVIAVIDPASN